mmetsp:Transcript_54315/g.168177  ORF Transcript_54315/g.168177 Transcript_54315/m.168177 type:complete len:80 (+) Transcript_54315:945-1184(+)
MASRRPPSTQPGLPAILEELGGRRGRGGPRRPPGPAGRGGVRGALGTGLAEHRQQSWLMDPRRCRWVLAAPLFDDQGGV